MKRLFPLPSHPTGPFRQSTELPTADDVYGR